MDDVNNTHNILNVIRLIKINVSSTCVERIGRFFLNLANQCNDILNIHITILIHVTEEVHDDIEIEGGGISRNILTGIIGNVKIGHMSNCGIASKVSSGENRNLNQHTIRELLSIGCSISRSCGRITFLHECVNNNKTDRTISLSLILDNVTSSGIQDCTSVFN